MCPAQAGRAGQPEGPSIAIAPEGADPGTAIIGPEGRLSDGAAKLGAEDHRVGDGEVVDDKQRLAQEHSEDTDA
jgi:hypothetical protein